MVVCTRAGASSLSRLASAKLALFVIVVEVVVTQRTSLSLDPVAHFIEGVLVRVLAAALLRSTTDDLIFEPSLTVQNLRHSAAIVVSW